MLNTIEYRPPNMGDLEEIVRINRISLPENYPIGYFIQLIKDCKDTSFVAVIEGKVMGYIITRVEKPFISGFFSPKRSKGHVISVAVLPEARGQGIGFDLVKQAMDKLSTNPTVGEITLEVRESNTAAIGLYRKLNFSVEKVLKKYYRDGESAYKMTFKFK